MITPKQVADAAAGNPLLQVLEMKIDAALRQAADENYWPCTVDLRGFDNVAEQVAMKYRAAGWHVNIFHYRRGGYFLELAARHDRIPDRKGDGHA